MCVFIVLLYLSRWYLRVGHELICEVVICAECPSDLTLYQQSDTGAHIVELILKYLNDFISLYVRGNTKKHSVSTLK